MAEIGQKVEIGTPLMEVDWALVRQEAKSSITEVVVTNMDQVHEMKVIASGLVDPSQDVLIVK